MGDFVLSFEEADKRKLNLVGGKVSGLGELLKAGFPVPPGFAVTSVAYREFIRYNSLTEKIDELLSPIIESPDNYTLLEEVSSRIRNLIEKSEIPEVIKDEVLSAYFRLGEISGISDPGVAVRSSATAEDMDDASFAGQHDTYLNVRGGEEVIDKVRRCWASLFTPRVILYRIRHGIDHSEAQMGVAVQKMVKSEKSGVMFTIHPTSGRRDVVVVEAVWGLGEGLVSGICTPDSHVINKITHDVEERRISSKEIMVVYDEEKMDNVTVEVPENMKAIPCLSDEELSELVRIAREIEKYYGTPQDIEWAIDGTLKFPHNVFILQSRPETVWSKKDRGPVIGRKSGYDLIMDMALKTFKIPKR